MLRSLPFPCPRCEASAGYPCVTPKGTRLRDPHKVRTYDSAYPPGQRRGHGPKGSYYFSERESCWFGPAIKTGDVVRTSRHQTEEQARWAAGLTGGSSNPSFRP